MRSRLLGLFVAVASFAAAGWAHSAPPAKACDLKKVEKAYWCDKCSSFLEAASVDTAKMTEKGKDHPVQQTDACLKTSVRCEEAGCGMSWSKDATAPACCKEHKSKDQVVRARVGVKCAECGAWAATAGAVKHTKENCAGKPARACEKSGTAPHAAA